MRADLIAAAWEGTVVGRGVLAVVCMAAAFVGLHSAKSPRLLFQEAPGATPRSEMSVTGPVGVTVETKRRPFEASARSSLRLNWRRGRNQCGANNE